MIKIDIEQNEGNGRLYFYFYPIANLIQRSFHRDFYVKQMKEILTKFKKWTSRRSLIDLLLKSEQNCCCKT